MILLVERDPQARRAIASVLRTLGFTVAETHSAGEALSFARRQPSRIRLLFTGVALPDMSGLELAAHLRSQVPGLKVIYVSAATDIVHIGGRLDMLSDSLTRPFGLEELTSKVCGLLGSETAPAYSERGDALVCE